MEFNDKGKVDNDMESAAREDSRGFSHRLREAMQGRSIREFASSATMSAGTLHNYLNDESLPTLDKLISLANTANVSLNWLATGRGPVHLEHQVSKLQEPGSEQATATEKRLDVALLTAILECLEKTIVDLNIEMSPEKKSSVTVSIYDLYSELGDKAVNKDKIFRLIESTVS